MRTVLDASLAMGSGKSALAQAIRYALTRWKALTRCAADRRLEMPNNAAEHAMRLLAPGRKNWMLCGSDAGSQRAACVCTITETAKLHGLNPQAYLTDSLGRIADHPASPARCPAATSLPSRLTKTDRVLDLALV